MEPISSVQVGKAGLSDNLIETIREHFKTHKNVKVHFLKSAGHDKKKIKKQAEEIVDKLGKNFTYKVIGFTVFLKKWRKDKR